MTELYKYTAYGKPTLLAANGTTVLTSSAISNRLLFTAREWDDALTSTANQQTGFYHFRARCLSPTLGRFISRDPLSYVDGPGLHRAYFVPRSIDPTGMVEPYGVPVWHPRPNPIDYPAGNVDNLGQHLNDKCCSKIPCPIAKEKCTEAAQNLQDALNRVRAALDASGGIVRFGEAGNNCEDCQSAVENGVAWAMGVRDFFDTRALHSIPYLNTPFWGGHNWHEIECLHTGDIVATIDFWVGSGVGRRGWMPGRDGFGWSPNFGRPGQPMPGDFFRDFGGMQYDCGVGAGGW